MNQGTLDELAEAQRALNRSSAERWDLFGSHRERLTDLVLQHLPPGRPRVCVLGAGNCNDLDLRCLTAVGAEIHLADIDGDALDRCVQRLPADVVQAVHIHGGIDVTGIWPKLAALRNHVPTDSEIAAVVESADRVAALQLPGPFDVVVSPALLTQIVASAAQAIGPDHPDVDPLALAIRAGHIRTMLSLTRPAGRAIFVTEIVSSAEVPQLRDAPEEALRGLTLRVVLLQNMYKTASPAAIVSWLGRTRPFGARLVSPGIVGPWRWRLSTTVSYLVIGILMTRR